MESDRASTNMKLLVPSKKIDDIVYATQNKSFLLKPLIIGSDDDPLPNILDANTFMAMSDEGKQADVVMSNSCMHIPLVQLEAGIVCEPQMTPLGKAEYVTVYDVVEALMVPPIVVLDEVY